MKESTVQGSLTTTPKSGTIRKVETPTPVAAQVSQQYDFRWFNLNNVTWDVARCNGCWPAEGGIDIVSNATLPITTLETGTVQGVGWFTGGYVISLWSYIPGFGYGDTYYMEYSHPIQGFVVGQRLHKGEILGYSTFLEVGINPPWCVAPWNSCSGGWVRNPRYLLTQEMEKGA